MRSNGFYTWFPGRSPPSQTQLCSPSQSQGFKALEGHCQQVALVREGVTQWEVRALGLDSGRSYRTLCLPTSHDVGEALLYILAMIQCAATGTK